MTYYQRYKLEQRIEFILNSLGVVVGFVGLVIISLAVGAKFF